MARSTTERRHARRVQDLRSLREQQLQQFLRVWQLFFQGWAQEVQHRARAQKRDASAEPIPAIFGVLRGARRLAQDVGVQRDRQVALSLLHLQHLCSKAVAGLMEERP